MADLTDGGWGESGNAPLASADNNPGRHDNQSSRAYTGPGVTPKYGFEAYAQHRLNQSGVLWGRKGAPAGYSDGPYKGMTPGQAQEAARAEYDAMPDDQRKIWENTASGGDIRSDREIAAGQAPQSPVMPQPPYTASGATPTAPATPADATSADATPAVAAAPAANPAQAASAVAAAPQPSSPAAVAAPVVPPAPVAAAPAPGAPSPSAFAAPVMGDPNDTLLFGPKLSGGGANPVTATTMNNGVATTAQPGEFNRASAPVAAAMPSSGGGVAPSDPSAFAGPSPKAAADPDIDPATGKKRAPAMN